MRTKTNTHSPISAKTFVRALSVVLATLLLTLPFRVQADPRAVMGSGNFADGDTGSLIVSQYNALNILGAKMSRMNLYLNNYWDGSAAVPTMSDSAVLQSRNYGVTPMLFFEYYSSDSDPLGGYSKWYAIGQAYATRFRPNSPWLVSQGVNNWGISIFAAINEPDLENGIPKTAYHAALEGLADGVHSVDATLKVIPGGFMAENAYSDSTLNGYGPAIADLLNDGTLDGIDLHTYNDAKWAPIIDEFGNPTFDYSPQSDFDDIKAASGITRDINFYSTEFNFANDPDQGTDENLAAKRFLTCIWANLGVVKNDGHTQATQFAFPYSIFLTDVEFYAYGLNTSLNPWVPRARGTTLQLVLDKSAGMEFVTLDPKGRGEYILNGSNKKMWVWQNYPTWSSIAGTSYNITGIPAGATKIEVYGWNGLRGAPITLSGQTSYNVTGLNARETYMFLVDAADGGGPSQPDLIVTNISWNPPSPVTGNAVTFNATIKNQGTAATPAGVIHRVGFSVDGTQVNWSDTSSTSLAPGATRVLTANNGPSGSSTWIATSGSHAILANVDNTSLIAESNESNNTLTNSLTVAAAQPDLIVTAISWSPTTPVAGNAVTFSATIKNQGTGPTPGGIIHGVEFVVDGVQVNWSDNSTTSLAAGATRVVTANNGPNGGSSTWTATSGTHTILAQVDDVNRIAESNEGNNTLTSSMTVAAAQPDLIVTAISWSPTTPVSGNAVTFSATIKNQGTVATPAGVVHRVGFFVDGTQVTWSINSTTSLAAGATRVVTANAGTSGATWTATTGTHTILANVDNTSLITESNESNNTLTSSMTVAANQPDLIVTSISWVPASPATGNAVTFSAVIKNQGIAATPAGVVHRVGFFVDGTQVTWSINSTTSLAAGASRTVTANAGTSGATWTATSGTHTILANVDNTSLITESNESNNTLTSSMTVTGGQPDLIVTAISWSPTTPVTGNAVTFSATIKNQGTGPTPGGIIHGVEFQVDGVQVSWSDNSTTSLAAGATRVVTANSGPSGSTWTATGGTHTILAHVDDVNRIAESNESNNTLTSSLTVAAGQPDLIVTNITWTPANPAFGNAVTFSAVIKNQGTGPTPAGIIHGVEFLVDGVQVSWSDNSTTSLAAGASRTVTANSGPNGGISTWTATHGNHTILAQVDDVNRIAESNETNNTFTKSLPVP